MSRGKKNAIAPTRDENYPEWYQQVVKHGELAENSSVRGCMVIKPWGYGVWELMQGIMDRAFKDTGHENAYFPLFIPKSHLEKEAEHVDGFAKECAVVTHSRLEQNEEGELVPASPLEEPLVVRPTSETIIGETYAKWVQSHRDLPIKINQWANVVRWEMRTRLFLRTAEFLWQEGHTAHATEEEAIAETRQMLGVYADFCENVLAVPVIKGIKSESERFPGAVETFCIESMMQDGKALQMGTSHFLGQNFAKAFDIKFSNEEGAEEHAWTTSWGTSTRMVGGLVMTHSDDDGLKLPPRIAPVHVVILPMLQKEETRDMVLEYCENLKKELEAKQYAGAPVRVKIDTRDLRGGEKMWQWVKKGVPVRVEVGPRDIAEDAVFVGRRNRAPSDKVSEKKDEFVGSIPELLQSIQAEMLADATAWRNERTVEIDSKEEFYEYFSKEGCGFALAHWNGSAEIEEQIKKELKVTIRCLPLEGPKTAGKCVITGEPSEQRVVFAKAY